MLCHLQAFRYDCVTLVLLNTFMNTTLLPNFYPVYCKFGNFVENFIFANSFKTHICSIENLLLGHGLPISVNCRVNSPFHEDLIFTKRSFAKIKPSKKSPNLQYLQHFSSKNVFSIRVENCLDPHAWIQRVLSEGVQLWRRGERIQILL